MMMITAIMSYLTLYEHKVVIVFIIGFNFFILSPQHFCIHAENIFISVIFSR